MMKKNEATKRQKVMTNEEMVDRLAEATGLSRQQVAGLLVELARLVKKSLDQGPDEVTLPGLLKLKIVRKRAREPGEKTGPAAKQETDLAAKNSRNVLRVVPSRELRDIVAYRWD
jgi:nucleoid DNA-binding protein